MHSTLAAPLGSHSVQHVPFQCAPHFCCALIFANSEELACVFLRNSCGCHCDVKLALRMERFSLESDLDFRDCMGCIVKHIYYPAIILPSECMEDFPVGNPWADSRAFMVAPVSET